MLSFCCVIFFFKQKTAYEMRISDWSSDVCSSDLFDLGRDIGDHAAHLLDPARARGDRIEVVADRLLARQLRNRAEDRLEEARRAGLGAFGEVDLHARRNRKSVV